MRWKEHIDETWHLLVISILNMSTYYLDDGDYHEIEVQRATYWQIILIIQNSDISSNFFHDAFLVGNYYTSCEFLRFQTTDDK